MWCWLGLFRALLRVITDAQGCASLCKQAGREMAFVRLLQQCGSLVSGAAQGAEQHPYLRNDRLRTLRSRLHLLWLLLCAGGLCGFHCGFTKSWQRRSCPITARAVADGRATQWLMPGPVCTKLCWKLLWCAKETPDILIANCLWSPIILEIQRLMSGHERNRLFGSCQENPHIAGVSHFSGFCLAERPCGPMDFFSPSPEVIRALLHAGDSRAVAASV